MQKDMDLNLTDGSSNSTPLSLFELCTQIRKTLKETFPTTYWVRAETSDVRINASSGHCYLEFIEKSEKSNQLLAKVRGAIWANVFRMLKPYFETETGQPFASGLKVLVQVTVEYHEVYGISLNVIDIDPTYTLGDLVRKRQEIIKRLQDEGIFNLNKELDFPTLPQRIAVISSPTAAGYGDFCHQLEHNPRGYSFKTKLFAAAMQGDRVEESILAALDKINRQAGDFDVVVIIRGGGATSDLSCFDTYLLAAACAQFPLPIITGIGHERDDTVLDSVAHTRVKTPTAAAELLIGCMDEAADHLADLAARMHESVTARLKQERTRLYQLCHRIPAASVRRVSSAKLALLTARKDLHRSVEAMLARRKHRLALLKQRLADASPDKLLARGYSITLKDGKAVKDASRLQAGDVLTTRVYQGEITSTVQTIK